MIDRGRLPAQTVGVFRMSEAVAYGFAAVGSAVLTLARTPLYTHWFDPAAYGDFTLLNTSAGLFSSIILAVFSNALYRYYDSARQEGSLIRLLASVTAGATAGLAVVLTVALFALRWIGFQAPHAAFWLTLLTIVLTLQGLVAQINRMEHRVAGFVSARLLDPLWQIAAPLLLLTLGFTGFQTLALTANTAGMAGLLVAAVVAWPVLKQVRLAEADWHTLKAAMNYGLPLVPLALSAWIITSSNRYAIHYFLGSEATGIFAMGYALAYSPIALASTTLIMAVGPVIWERLNREGSRAALNLVRRSAMVYFALAMPAAIGLGFLGDELISLLFSANYEPAHDVVFPVALGAVFAGLYNFLVKPWELHEATGQVPLYVGIGALTNLFANLLLIPRMGIAGAGWAGLLAHAVVAVVMIAAATRQYGFRIITQWTDVLVIGVACLTMTMVLSFCEATIIVPKSFSLVVLTFVGAITYAVAFLMLGMRFKSDVVAIGMKRLWTAFALGGSRDTVLTRRRSHEGEHGREGEHG